MLLKLWAVYQLRHKPRFNLYHMVGLQLVRLLPRLRTAYELRRQSQLQLRKLDVLQQLPAQPDGNLYLLRCDDDLLRLPLHHHEVFAVQLNSAQLRQLLLHLWFVCRFCQLCQSQPQLWKLAELLRYSAQTDGKLFHLRIQHL